MFQSSIVNSQYDHCGAGIEIAQYTQTLLLQEGNMTQKKGERKSQERSLDAGRLETPIVSADPEIQEEFREAQHRGGSGAQVLKKKLREHTSTGPELSGGDIDADWEDAENVGDEAASGDNPTPDQSIVDLIGEAVGDTQEDGKPLRTAAEKFSPRKQGWVRD
jgi:hypothetical protein